MTTLLCKMFYSVNTTRSEYNKSLKFFEQTIREYFTPKVNDLFLFIDKNADLVFYYQDRQYNIRFNEFEEFMQNRDNSKKVSVKELKSLLDEY